MKQLGLWIDHAIYGKDNQVLILGKMRFQNYPLMYYGIGNNISNKPLAIVPANYYNVRERFVYRLKGNLFAGLEMDYQQLANPDFDWHEHVHRHDSALPTGGNGSKNLGLGVGVLWDSRHNILNVREGFLAEVAFLHYGKIFNESFPMNTLFLDGRYFHAVKKNQVLALQVVGQFSSGDVPFNQLSLMGGEMIMRGQYLGKFRDKQYVAAQAEYRFLPFGFSKRLGGAVFASAGAVSSSFPTQNYKIAGGAGLRYLLFPKKDIFTRIDVGFEKEGYGIYFFIGEAF
jgi:outer membrane protein assembly factor BamA